MSRSQRLTFLGIAAAIVVVAVVVRLLAGGGGGSSTAEKAATRGVPVLVPGTTKKLTYVQGDEVRFRVRVTKDDEVHVHGYNIERPLKAGRPRTIAFRATINGVFEIELHHANVQIAELRVEPK